MKHYFAVFMPTIEGGYGIVFPDIPEALSGGENLDECMEMASEVLAVSLEEYTKARKPLPKPSTLEQTRKYAHSLMQEPGIDSERKYLLQLIPAPDVDMTPVRINISLAKYVLDGLDMRASQAGLTRSGYIAKAVQAGL